MDIVILSIGLLVFTAHLLTQVFRKTHIPDVLLLMVIGLLLGPILQWITPTDFGKAGGVISTIALVVILFEGGTSLEVNTVKRSIGITGKLTLSCFVATGLIVGLIAFYWLKFSWMNAALLGMILGGTSSAVVIPMVGMLNLSEKPSAVLVLESALTDVLCIVGVFALLHIAADGGAVEYGKLFGSVMAAMVFAMTIGVLGGIGWLVVLRKVRDFPNTIFSTLAYVFIVYGITEVMGFSGGIAALALGITLTNYEQFGVNKIPLLAGKHLTPLTDVDLQFFREAVFLLKTFFFVYLGISIRFSDAHIFYLALAMMAAVFAARILLTRFVMDKDYNSKDAAITSLMAPKGLAAAVLATLPLQYGIAGGEQIRDVTYMAVLVSIALCSVLTASYSLRPIQWFYRMLLK